MKTKILILIILFFVILVFVGTGCMTVEHTIYLGDAEVNSTLIPPPTHLNINKKPGQVTVSARFSKLTNNNLFESTTSDRYFGSIKVSDSLSYSPKQKNLSWNVQRQIFAADIDIMLSKGFSIFGGINAAIGETDGTKGGNIGFGFHDLKTPIRLDIGLNIQNCSYSAITIVKTKTSSMFGTDEYTNIYMDKGRETNINPFFTVTLNSAKDSTLLNYFGTFGLFFQNILGHQPGETHTDFFGFEETIDKRESYTCTFLYLNPGLCFSLNPNIKILASVKILAEVNDDIGKTFILPSIKMDFQL